MFHDTLYSMFQVLAFIFLPIIAPHIPTTLFYAILFVVLAPALTSALAPPSQITTPRHALTRDAEDDLTNIDFQDEPENDWWDSGIASSDKSSVKEQSEALEEEGNPQDWGYPRTEYWPEGVSLGPKYPGVDEFIEQKDVESRMPLSATWDEEENKSDVVPDLAEAHIGERIISLLPPTPLPDHIFDKPEDLLSEVPTGGLSDTLQWICYIMHDLTHNVTASPASSRIIDHLIRAFKAEKLHPPLHQLVKAKVDEAVMSTKNWLIYPFFEMDLRVFEKFEKELKMQEISRRLKIEELLADLEKVRDEMRARESPTE